MSYNFTELLLVHIGYVVIFSLLLLFIIDILNKKWPNKFFYYINRVLVIVLAISSFIVLFNFLFSVLASTVLIVFSIFEKFFYSIFSSSNASKYLSLVVTLIILAYMPEQIGLWFLRIIGMMPGFKYDFASMYKKFIRFVRPKIWIYLFALVITLFSCTEKFLNRDIISFAYWVESKSVILQSVVTFIAFDRFLKLLIDEWISIKNDITGIYRTFLMLKIKKHD